MISFIAAKWRGTSATQDGVLFHEPDREIRCTTADPLEAHPAVHQSHPGHHTAHDLRKLPLRSHKLLRQQPHSYGAHLLPRLGLNKRGLCLSTRSAHYLIPNQKSKGLCQSVQEVTKIWPDLENWAHLLSSSATGTYAIYNRKAFYQMFDHAAVAFRDLETTAVNSINKTSGMVTKLVYPEKKSITCPKDHRACKMLRSIWALTCFESTFNCQSDHTC